MATGVLQTLGVGSGLDINSLVNQLVAAEMQPDNARLSRQSTQVGAQLSALGKLKGALSSFQISLNSLSKQSDFLPRTVKSGDEDVLTATATAGAAAGTYQVEVTSLATAHQLISNTFVGDGTATVGTGTLTFSLGTSTFSVAVDDAHSSLNSIRDAINNASNNPGIGATIVHGAGTAQLVLSSNATGVSKAIVVDAEGGNGGLNQLIYSPSQTGNYTQLEAAQDASVKVAGVSFSSANNAVSGAIDGVTLNLVAAAPGQPIAVEVSNDNGTVTNRVQVFVDAYNSLQSVINELGGYDAAANKAGPLYGDAIVQGLSTQLRRTLSSIVGGSTGEYTTLASLGITTNRDGTLTLDPTKLSTALKTNSAAVSNIFTATDGVATQLLKTVGAQLNAGGTVPTRDKTLSDQQQQITDRQLAIAARQEQVRSRYLQQFTAMDKLLSQLQQTSTFLTGQFDALKSINSKR